MLLLMLSKGVDSQDALQVETNVLAVATQQVLGRGHCLLGERIENKAYDHAVLLQSKVHVATVTPPHISELRHVASPIQNGTNLTIASKYGGYTADWSFVRANHLAYAKRHNLNYFAPISDKPFTWHGLGHNDIYFSTFAIVQFLFDSGADAVFWMDADSAFVNVDQDIRSFLAEAPSKDLIVSGDLNVFFNAGHFMVRKSEWSMNLLRTANSLFPSPEWMDNGAFLAALGGADPSRRQTWLPSMQRLARKTSSAAEADQANRDLDNNVSQHMLILPQDAMNSYGRSGAGHTFIRHYAGIPISEKLAGLRSDIASVDIASKSDGQ